MPSRYIMKNYEEGVYYHVFNRGVEKRDIFMDSADFSHFLYLLERYVGDDPKRDTKSRLLPNYNGMVELSAYCLMPNHFHLLLFNLDIEGIQKLMASVATAYTMYFNKRHNRVGKLFQSRYKAVAVKDEAYYMHISRYIHLNPLDIGNNYEEYGYSSVRVWLGQEKKEWIKPGAMLESPSQDYREFLADYVGRKAELKAITEELGL